jgi:transketolase
MTVLAPCDFEETKKAIHQAVRLEKPVYIRFGREKTPVITTESSPFNIGKANLLRDSEKVDVAIISCGPLTQKALIAAEELSKDGIECSVLNNHTIKPMDEAAVIEVAKKAGKVVTVEEHQVNGGMGSAVAEVLSKNNPVAMEFIGVQDKFGQSGEPDELIEHYGMGVDSIKKAVEKVLKR